MRSPWKYHGISITSVPFPEHGYKQNAFHYSGFLFELSESCCPAEGAFSFLEDEVLSVRRNEMVVESERDEILLARS